LTLLGAGLAMRAAEAKPTPLPPGPYPQGDGQASRDAWPKTPAGARGAQATVRDYCGDSFCTIQIDPTNRKRYLVYWLWGCDTWKLNHFQGRFDAHNGGSLIVDLLDRRRHSVYRLWGDGKTVVNWDKVYYIRTCNKK
jgi:hypothetical protein